MGEGREITSTDHAPPSYDTNLIELSATLVAMHEEAEAMCAAGAPADQSAFKHIAGRRGLMLGLVRAMPASTPAGLLAKARVLTIPDLGVVDPQAGWQLAASLAADVVRIEGVRAHG